MANLINADKLKRKCQKFATEAWKLKIKASAETVMNQFIDFINEADIVDVAGPAWIPCTDGLPGVYIDVIVSSKRGVQVMHMTPGGYWTDGAQLDAPGYVEAGMPMPEPWKGAE